MSAAGDTEVGTKIAEAMKKFLRPHNEILSPAALPDLG